MSSKHLILSVILTLSAGAAWAQDEPEDDEKETTELSGYSVQSDMRSGFETEEGKAKLEKPDFSRDFKMDSIRPSMSGMNVESSRPKLKVLGPPPEQPAAAAERKPARNEGSEGSNVAAAASSQQPAAGSTGQTTEIRPLQMDPPDYPTQAMRRRQEGSVTLEFTVTADGSTDNISVVRANPPRVFDREAVRAVSRWKFEPAKVNGTPQAQRIRHTIEFTLN